MAEIKMIITDENGLKSTEFISAEELKELAKGFVLTSRGTLVSHYNGKTEIFGITPEIKEEWIKFYKELADEDPSFKEKYKWVKGLPTVS